MYKKVKSYTKMDKKIVKFDDTEIEEYTFYQYKIPISISNIDINETVVSKKFPFGKCHWLQRLWEK